MARRRAQRVQDAEAMPRRERGTLMSAGMRWRPFDIATGYAGAEAFARQDAARRAGQAGRLRVTARYVTWPPKAP